MTFRTQHGWFRVTALICIAVLLPCNIPLLAQSPAAGAEPPKLKSPDQLDGLVSPIALYPDPLLAQVLAASTYPLEIVEAERWLKANTKLTGEALTTAASNQSWDPSVQALVAFPSALSMLDGNIQWTTDLGNAFLDQQSDVMDAVQRMRKTAKDDGKLATTKEQNVEVKTVESKTVIEVVPADPQVIYVPAYNPTVVWGASPYWAYPPLYYPPPPYGAVAATAAISFGVGVAMGAFWGGCCRSGGWGWGVGWGGNNHVTVNNNFQSRYYHNTNININNSVNVNNSVNRGNGNWQHDPSHRKAVPYSSGSTAQRFGGEARNSAGNMQRFDRGSSQPRNMPAQNDRAAQNARAGQNAGAAQNDRGGQNDRAGQNRGVGQSNDRAAGGGSGGGQLGGRTPGGGQSRSPTAGAGQDRIGNRSVDSGSGRQSALGGSGSPSRSQAASDRGFSSTRQSGGGSPGGGAGAAASRAGGGRRR